MITEHISYRDNLQHFIDTIKDAFIEGIGFAIDTNPTFDPKAVPFNFKYCHSVTIITDKGNFCIHTSATSSGMETFWILAGAEVNNSLCYQEINSGVKSIVVKKGYEDYPFKLKIEFENTKLFLYAADIYDQANGDLDYKINDEMILAFDNEHDAELFERMLIMPSS